MMVRIRMIWLVWWLVNELWASLRPSTTSLSSSSSAEMRRTWSRQVPKVDVWVDLQEGVVLLLQDFDDTDQRPDYPSKSDNVTPDDRYLTYQAFAALIEDAELDSVDVLANLLEDREAIFHEYV